MQVEIKFESGDVSTAITGLLIHLRASLLQDRIDVSAQTPVASGSTGSIMPTGIGLIFITLGLYFTIKKPQYLFGLLLFTTIFPATSAITFGSLWIMPYYVIAPMFLLSQFLRGALNGFRGNFSGKTALLLFGCFGVLSALTFPFLFAGVPVYSPRLGSSDDTFIPFPLVFNVGNLAQAGYLAVNVLVVLAAAVSKKAESVWVGINAAFYFLTCTIFIELACVFASVPFPYTLIENSPDRATLESRVLDPASRLQGTCGEPSYAGLILVMFFGAYFYRFYTGKGNGFKALLSVVALLLVRSSSALIAMVAVGAAVMIFNPPFRAPSLSSPSALKMGRFLRLLPIVLAVVLSFSSSTIRDLIQEWVLDKPASGSYFIRTTMDQYSVDLLLQTYGLGVGIGSFRPSSLLASLAGNVGVIGTLIFLLLCVQLILAVRSKDAWIRWSLVAALIDMGVAIPDITHPILWALLALTVYVIKWGSTSESQSLRQPAENNLLTHHPAH